MTTATITKRLKFTDKTIRATPNNLTNSTNLALPRLILNMKFKMKGVHLRLNSQYHCQMLSGESLITLSHNGYAASATRTMVFALVLKIGNDNNADIKLRLNNALNVMPPIITAAKPRYISAPSPGLNIKGNMPKIVVPVLM